MANFEIRFKESVSKDLRHLPNKDVKRILQRIEALRNDPRPAGCDKLSTQERYRVRQGVYRIIYEVRDNELVVIVVKVGHRREVYNRG
ncbi:MAG: type II toxin-antitoxin system RelE/ParE family toxin [Dethiobacter sp.]|jgi:mRNA interferase RelE/StbE|nr:type II toxin-antitoxin system RelE/ParE family toxin [Dethiobacter sp.]MBS3988601.1 type II toxin-antitoxin system RelE/ParE family toxin [Dethiobacter sp.]